MGFKDEEAAEQIPISCEVTTSEDGLSLSLSVTAEEPLTYEEFLQAVRTFLEAEEAAAQLTH